MLENIKYSALRLRSPQSPVTLEGPGTNSLRPVKLTLGGNILSFCAPKHRPHKSSFEQISPTNFNSMDFGSRDFSEHIMPDQSWKSRTCFLRAWRFCGPWFTGVLGRVSMSISILEPSKLNKDTSFFHPKVLENTIFNYLSSEHAHKDKANRVEAPVDWEPLMPFSVPAARFSIKPKHQTNGTQQSIILPISDTHLIEIYFRFSYSYWDDETSSRKLLDPQPLHELADQIISTLQLELSETSQAQLDRVMAEFPDMKLTETFAPIDWEADKKAIAQ